MKRVAFFFIGADRTAMMAGAQNGTLPDSGLRGANFFAERKDWHVDVLSTEQLEKRIPRFIRAFVPMSLVQLLFFPRLVSYDAVIASDAFLLGWAIATFSRTQWIYVAINSSVLMLRHAHHPVRRAILRGAWKSFPAIVCLAEKQREDLRTFGIPEKKMSVVRFGIDTVHFDGKGAGAEPVILSIGKDMSRDYATVFAAAEMCGLPIEIVASPKNIPPGPVPKNVTIDCDVKLHELKAMYARARFVVVSLFSEEKFGGDPSGQTVLLESLAMGRAVIATERSWLSEYLDTEKDILTVPIADPAALASAMQKLWENEGLRAQLAAHGQQTVREKYSSRRFTDDLMSVVERHI